MEGPTHLKTKPFTAGFVATCFVGFDGGVIAGGQVVGAVAQYAG